MNRNKDEKERRKLNRKLMKRTFISEMKEPKFQRFANEYMGIGMCLGLSIGQAKDSRLEQNAMEISRIEHLAGFTEVFIYAIDKNGIEKEFRVSDKVMKLEKFATGDKVAEEREGVLVSLESK